MDAPCRIRQAGSADTDALLDLERACFSDPWSEPGMREVLAAPSTVALAAETGSILSGYAVARSVAGAAEILTFGVLPRFHRRGIARELLRELLARLGSEGVRVWLKISRVRTSARSSTVPGLIVGSSSTMSSAVSALPRFISGRARVVT